jgi:hypothetical protein
MKRLIPLLLFVLGAFVPDARAADWSFWRGPEQNGISREKDLPDSWSPDPKAPDNNLIWTAPYGGITTPILQNGRSATAPTCKSASSASTPTLAS